MRGDMDVRLGAKKPINLGVDGEFIEKESFVHVGKEDGSISLFNDGQATTLLEQAILQLNTQITGKIEIPTSTNKFIIQWSRVTTGTNLTSTRSFSFPFPNACLGVIGTQTDGESVTALKVKPISNLQFELTVAGGTDNKTIQWIAFGH